MATSASAFAAELAAAMDADRPGCTTTQIGSDRACGAPGGLVALTCRDGHRLTVVMCPRHLAVAVLWRMECVECRVDHRKCVRYVSAVSEVG